MSIALIDPHQDTATKLRQAILKALPDARVEVSVGTPGHFSLKVAAETFRGKSLVGQQQLVYAAIAEFMRGDNPPVHAIDRLQTLA